VGKVIETLSAADSIMNESQSATVCEVIALHSATVTNVCKQYSAIVKRVTEIQS
jgi:hypothetical protein